MTFADISERERAELQRSTIEAAKIVLSRVEVDRYLNPPPDTPYPLEYAFHLLGVISGNTVLDLGCGTGENLIPLIRRGASVIGMDLSPDLLDIARRRLSEQGFVGNAVTLEVGSAYETGLPSQSVDVVFSMVLLHHLDLEAVSREIYRVLKPGGRCILREPIRFSRTMNFLRKLFPSPKADVSDFEHPLTRQELAVVTKSFTTLANRSFRLPFIPLLSGRRSARRWLWQIDSWLLLHFPRLEHFATCKVMSLQLPS